MSGTEGTIAEARCSVDECGKPVKRKGFCYGHYMKQWRYGTPTPVHPSTVVDIKGRRFGSLVVMHRGDGHWVCRCDCGAGATVRAGDLNRGTTTSCGDRRLHRRQDFVEYWGAHDRVYEDRGPASEQQCVDCDRRAEHWSYDHADPDELVSHSPRSAGAPYSLDPMHYAPRCVPCHWAFDRTDHPARAAARARQAAMVVAGHRV